MDPVKELSRRTLLVDGDRTRSGTIRRYLEDGGLEVVERHTLSEALAMLRQPAGVEALLLDISLAREPGVGPLHRILEIAPTLAVVVLTDDLDEESTLEAVRSGAQGYLLGSHLNPTLVQQTVSHAVAIRRAEGEVHFAESMVLDSETRYRSLFDLSKDAICVVDVDGIVFDANEAARKMLGESVRELLGCQAADLISSEEDRDRVRAALADRQALPVFETTASHRDGAPGGILLTLVPRTTSLGEFIGYYFIVRDNPEGKTAAAYPKEGLYDALTGLPNRSLFLDRLNRVMAGGKRHDGLRYAVLFIDLDGFKTVNDTLGHLLGDELLLQVAGRLGECVREGDTVGRMGGDEFVVLLGEIDDIEDATVLADRFIRSLARPFQIGDREVVLSCSVGITVGGDEVTAGPELLRQADYAMYQAKSHEKGTYQIYDRVMQARIMEALQLDKELRQALPRDELTVRYQPIMHADTEQVDSFQALLFWKHPVRGLIPSTDFLASAEKLGLGHAISTWVIAEVCRQIKKWSALHPKSPSAVVSVPFSPAEFSRPDFVIALEAHVRAHDLSPGCLRLELPVSALAPTSATDPGPLARLQQAGFRASVVDFGIGPYSWLALRPTPVDRLKIHASYLAREPRDGAESATRRLAEMAHGLGMTSLSDGVDTERQLQEVRDAGSSLAQGRHFHEPLTASAAGKLLGKARGDEAD